MQITVRPSGRISILNAQGMETRLTLAEAKTAAAELKKLTAKPKAKPGFYIERNGGRALGPFEGLYVSPRSGNLYSLARTNPQDPGSMKVKELLSSRPATWTISFK